jgi:Carboxypeptidase regulatory-like domain
MTIRRIALTLFLAQLALSQGGGMGSIQGVVLNSYTNQPVPGASVELMGIQRGRVLTRTVRTGEKGEFKFPNVPPGSGYQLVVTGERLQATAYGQKTRNEPWAALNLEPGAELNDLKIFVQPLAAIRGRVVDNQGRGIFGARVVALTPVYSDLRRTLQGNSTTEMTNSKGDYQFTGLPAGLYYLRVAAQNTDLTANTLLSAPSRFDRAPQNGSTPLTGYPDGYPITYFPSTVEVESAKPINLAAGGEVENADITVTRVRTGRVRGSVKYDGIAVQTGQVVLQREATALQSSWTRVVEIREGQFDIRGVLPGTYIAWTQTGEGTGTLWGRTPVEVRGGETITKEVKVSPPPDIVGKVSVEGSTDTTELDLTPLAVGLDPDALSPIDTTLQRNELVMGSRSEILSRDGRFEFHRVAPWDYRVVVQSAVSTLGNASPLRRVYVKSIRNGNSDIADKGLQLSNVFEGSLEIILGQDSGGLDGRVVDEGQDSGGTARVVLVPEARHRRDLYFPFLATTTGRFQLQGVAPGKYKIFAWKDAPRGSWYDPDFLRMYEDRALTVDVAPGSAEYVELKRLP